MHQTLLKPIKIVNCKQASYLYELFQNVQSKNLFWLLSWNNHNFIKPNPFNDVRMRAMHPRMLRFKKVFVLHIYVFLHLMASKLAMIIKKLLMYSC